MGYGFLYCLRKKGRWKDRWKERKEQKRGSSVVWKVADKEKKMKKGREKKGK